MATAQKMLFTLSLAWFVIAMKDRCRWIPIVITNMLSTVSLAWFVIAMKDRCRWIPFSIAHGPRQFEGQDDAKLLPMPWRAS